MEKSMPGDAAKPAEVPLQRILEAALLAADSPLSPEQLRALFEEPRPAPAEIRRALGRLEKDCAGRGVELCESGGAYRFQTRPELAPWLQRLWEARPRRDSRALLEILALIAWRQPLTRAEIEAVRGVPVNPQIVRVLLEREWIRVAGHKEVPGRPELLVTTREFLEHFHLGSLEDLPPLEEPQMPWGQEGEEYGPA